MPYTAYLKDFLLSGRRSLTIFSRSEPTTNQAKRWFVLGALLEQDDMGMVVLMHLHMYASDMSRRQIQNVLQRHAAR